MTLITSNLTQFYSGKVRDVYSLNNHIFIISSDRISAFDHILPHTIPYKGAVLNLMSSFFLKETAHLVPNWWIKSPCSHLSIGHKCESLPIEVIVRGYLSGSMWRAYEKGARTFCGNKLPHGLKKNQKLDRPIITPTTKAAQGHDEDTTESLILSQNIVTDFQWNTIKQYAYSIFEFGTQYALSKDLILVDTKFEFGIDKDNKILLIDEILTPDSSRYFKKVSYLERFESGEEPDQLSKEFVRQWLISQGFMGRDGEQIPPMSAQWIQTISERYIDLYNQLMPNQFDRAINAFDLNCIQCNYNEFCTIKKQ